MACRKPSDCAPCSKCPPTPDPVMPRCNDIEIPDGTFTNATVVVENGCIISIQEGNAPQYTPDNCCAGEGTGGGEGGDGLPGDQGEPGAAATIQPGVVTTVPYGQPATVTNTGTANAAIFNFEIPRGPAGPPGESVTGLNDNTAGIEIVNGGIVALPMTWPPMLSIAVDPPILTPGVVLTAVKDPLTGAVAVSLNIDAVVGRISTLETQVADLLVRVAALEAP